MAQVDAIVVGSGPNGLAAAITLAQAGLSVELYEAKSSVGGGMRTAELTLPGFHHDICSAIHPLGIGSPFFRSIPLHDYGLEWIQPELSVAHPLDNGEAAAQFRSIEETAAALGQDGDAYRWLMEPIVRDWDKIAAEVLRPLRFPSYPIAMAQFGLRAIWPASLLAKTLFRTEKARAFLAGFAAHSILPLEVPPSAAFGLVLAILGHAVGWGFPRGGSQQIANAMAAHFESLGGKIFLNTQVDHLDSLPKARAYLLDVTPRQLGTIAGARLPDAYQRALSRYRYGMGIFKVDWALDAPIPWTAPECHRTATVHVGGTLAEIAESERVIWQGQHSTRPYMIVAQQSLFDPTRVPDGKHTAWGYCHVPQGSQQDMTAIIENQIERFAPGFKDRILAKHTMTTHDYETYNLNYIGGDINGGVPDFLQLFTRPTISWRPYRTPAKGVYLCSASTPPGGGVHGMCGFFAARTVLSDLS